MGCRSGRARRGTGRANLSSRVWGGRTHRSGPGLQKAGRWAPAPPDGHPRGAPPQMEGVDDKACRTELGRPAIFPCAGLPSDGSLGAGSSVEGERVVRPPEGTDHRRETLPALADPMTGAFRGSGPYSRVSRPWQVLVDVAPVAEAQYVDLRPCPLVDASVIGPRMATVRRELQGPKIAGASKTVGEIGPGEHQSGRSLPLYEYVEVGLEGLPRNPPSG